MDKWRNLPLDEIANIVTGTTPKGSNPDDWGDTIDFLTPSDQIDGYREVAPARRLSELGAARYQSRIVPAGSTALTCIASVGKVSMTREPTLTNQQINTLVAKPAIMDPNYLYYMILHWSPQLQLHASGSATPIVNKSTLSTFDFLIPPLAVQQAVGEVLGALDDKIASNRKLADVASRLAQSRFEHVSRHQPPMSINEVLEPILGGTPSRSDLSYWGGKNLWISAKDVTNAPSSVVFDTEEKITDLAVASTKAKPLPRGSVIVTARGTVGKIARLGSPASFNQSCYGFRPDPLPPAVLYLSLVTAMQRALSYAHGSVFSTITKKTFDYLEIPSFESEELAAIENTVAPLLDTVEAAMRENHALAETRDALLPALMSGKLRVKDAERQIEAVI